MVDNNERPLNEPVMILRNRDEEIVMSFSAETAGRYPSLHIQDGYISSIQIQSLRFKPLTISADSLRGYQSQIKVSLSESRTYYSKQKNTFKYLIQEINKNRVVLDCLGKNQRIILRRQDAKQ